MINKENDNKQEAPKPEPKDGFIDTARMDVNCHILIKDSDSGEVLLNKRG